MLMKSRSQTEVEGASGLVKPAENGEEEGVGGSGFRELPKIDPTVALDTLMGSETTVGFATGRAKVTL